jgi:hypothetical protein
MMNIQGLDYNTERRRIPVRHYGRLLFEVFEKLMDMPDGEERKALTQLTVSQMYRDLMTWGMGTVDAEKVASDLARFTNGEIQLTAKEVEEMIG